MAPPRNAAWSTETNAAWSNEGRVALVEKWVIMTSMRKTSIANAKAHFSKLVDLAEHRGQRVLILRHGKPAAAIVPVDVAAEERPRMTLEAFDALLDRMIAAAPKTTMTIDAALGRGRLDGIR
jgi:prevent-host-death family protein